MVDFDVLVAEVKLVRLARRKYCGMKAPATDTRRRLKAHICRRTVSTASV
jgi:hypothetical protein